MTVEPNDFACDCGKDGKARCAEVTNWAKGYLKATDDFFVSRLIMELHHAYYASIDSIGADHWFGIQASTYPDAGKDNQFHTYMQADKVEDGLAFTLRAFYDRFGQSRPIAEDDDGDD